MFASALWFAIRRAGAVGEAKGRAAEQHKALDEAAKSDEDLQEYIERRAKGWQ